MSDTASSQDSGNASSSTESQSGQLTVAGGGGGGDDRFVVLKLVGQDGREIHYRARKGIKMKKVMRNYAGRVGAAYNELRFLYDGEMVMENATPEQMEMDNDDVIEVYSKQSGGGVY